MVEIRAVRGLAASSRRAAADPFVLVAEADGNRTRQAGDARLNGFEDRGAHQDPDASAGRLPAGSLARHASPSLRSRMISAGWRSGR
jgi:hypothetical protein